MSFLLFGIFFLPILFQSFHIVWHHSHGYQSEHCLSCHETTDTDSCINIENISEKEKTCMICAYQFSINDVAEISFFTSVIPVFACIFGETATQQQYKQVVANKSPRAPPSFTS